MCLHPAAVSPSASRAFADLKINHSMTPSTDEAAVLEPVSGSPRKTHHPRRLWGWSAVALIAIGGILFLRHGRAGADADGNPRTALPILAVAKVERQDLSQAITISGEFRPFQQVSLHAKVAGFLQKMNVDVGDHVREGDVIAQLDVPELKNELEKAAAALRASEEEVTRAEAGFAEAHLSYTRLKEVARQHPNLVAQQDLDAVQARDATSGSSVSVARSHVEESQAEVSRIQALVTYTTITAPFAGVVTRRSFDPGALVQAGTSAGVPLVELAEDTRLRFVFPVPESIVPLVKIGSAVRINVTSMGTDIEGKISRYAGKVDRSTRTMSTEVDVDNRDARITPGMYASVAFITRESKDAIAVPVQAIAVGLHPSVLVVGNGDIVEERPVKLGLETPDKTEILEGLKPGEVVLVGTRSGIRPGQKVATKVMATASLN